MKNYLRLLRNHERPFRFVLARCLMATGLCKCMTIQQDGFRLRFHPANLSSQLWIDPSSRKGALAFFRAYLKEGDTVVDVGANVGDTVMAASLIVGMRGVVWGIEAHPRTFEFFIENLRLNDIRNVIAINSAVGARGGDVRFSDDRRDDMNCVGGGELVVPIERLDHLVPPGLRVRLLKVDVEGYEKFVFDGAPSLLKHTECVFFEVSSCHFERFEYTTGELLELLASAGFKLFRCPGDLALEAISVNYDTERFENLVAIRDVPELVRRTGWTVL